MEQLYELEVWQYRQLRGALTAARRGEADAAVVAGGQRGRGDSRKSARNG